MVSRGGIFASRSFFTFSRLHSRLLLFFFSSDICTFYMHIHTYFRMYLCIYCTSLIFCTNYIRTNARSTYVQKLSSESATTLQANIELVPQSLAGE